MNKSQQPLISIQILNWNRAEETQRAIQSALDQTYQNIEVVVVDNGSTDNSIALTKQNFPNVKLLQLDKNYGCPGGRNRGIEHCSGEYIFYLDNDGVLHENAVENALNVFINNPETGIVTGIVYDFESIEEVDSKCEIKNPVNYLFNEFQGGISMHKKELYDIIGLYPDHFMYGAEETYLSFKIHDTDYNIIKDESVVLWHKKSVVARNVTKESLRGYYNKLYLALALYPFKAAVTFLTYFLLKYPYYAYKKNVLGSFLKGFPSNFTSTFFRAINDRKPISKNAYKSYFQIGMENQ